jgi:hypothetical protein
MLFAERGGLHGLHCHLAQQNSELGVGSSVGKEVDNYSIREITLISNLRTPAKDKDFGIFFYYRWPKIRPTSTPIFVEHSEMLIVAHLVKIIPIIYGS